MFLYFYVLYMRKLVAFFIILFSLAEVSAQIVIDKNIVPNGGFENYRKKSDNLKNAIPWVPVSSVDYYQQPLSNDTSKCKGARTGDCYIGLRLQKKYKEFIEVKLSQTLKRGNNYQFECYLRLAFWSNALLKSFGIYLSKGGMKSVTFPEKECVLDTVNIKTGLNGDYCWFKFKGVYKASGGEKYITIGNFAPNLKEDMLKINPLSAGFKEAYYFVDDISLKWIKPKDDFKTVYVDSVKYEKDSVLQVNKNVQTGEKITLRVIFQQGKSLILAESFTELNKLAQYLFRNPTIEIRIDGHSDNGGSKGKNQRLSEERARSVFEYLITHGVQNKMFYKGYGSSVPIADNDTDQGRAINRRVEFEIVKW